MQIDVGKEYFFTLEEYQQRLANVRRLMERRGIDLLLVSEPENIYYLTGHQTFSFSSFQMAGIPLEGEPFLILRYFESIQARRMSYVTDIVTWDDIDDPVAITVGALRDRRLIDKKVGVEEQGTFLLVSTWRRLSAAIAELKDASLIVDACRATKSPQEVAYMRQAAAYTDAGMQAAMNEIRAGATENDIAGAICDAMARAGSEWLIKDPIVTSGERSGIPHTTYHRRKLGTRDAVLLEFSGVQHRYSGPMMRSAWVGPPDPKIDRLAQICLEALDKAIAVMRPGVSAGEVDAACLKVINREGLWENFRKRTGYSVGCGFMSWMEVGISSLKADDPTVLAPGMCFHLPVAVRLYGEAGLGFSETVVVTETGAEPIGKFPRTFVHK